jgi:non-specific serine/threonine protein kinase
MLALFRGDYELALKRLEESLERCRDLNDPQGVGYALNYLAGTALSRGDYAAARPLYEESLSIFRSLGDAWGTRAGLNNLGEVARGLGDYAAASKLYQECVDLSRAAGDRFMEALGLTNLASTAHEQGQVDRARSLAAQSLILFREQGAITDGLLCLEVLAGVAAARGQPARAARLFGAAATLLEAAGVVFQGNEQAAHDRDVARARSMLDEPKFTAEWSAGRAMPLAEAVEFALENSPSSAPKSDGLTPREREVVALVANGLTNRQIAAELVITEGTAELHVSRILSKLGFHTRAQVAAWATQERASGGSER